eukprot:comp19219_c0_seq4/m.35948 comp19219_c0_seq4/g.35948  ORF comp19219_c0_seq4/g.35948 comp19219_c0_seq4/m.35948 type:complete len:197 (-) comp19219_c0_seq4:197-787(-)
MIAYFSKDNQVGIVMERMKESLLDRTSRGPMPVPEVIQVCLGLVRGLAYLHARNIIHRDLKPENILLISSGSATDIKLCDFGHSALGADDKAGFGTYSYLAPEVILNHQGTNAIDLWSIGVILYVLLSGTFPFDSSDDQRMFSEIVHGKYSFPESHWKRVTPTARDLITCLMCVDPKKRYTIQQALRHPWFAGVYF